MAAAGSPSTMEPWERSLLIARAALVADRATAVVEKMEVEALAARRRLRLAESTLGQVNCWVAVLRENSRLTKEGELTTSRAAAFLARSEEDALSVASRLRSAEAELVGANKMLALLLAVEDVKAVAKSVFPDGYEVYDGYLHFNGACTGVFAD